jgi:hypothetical protein
MSDDHHRRSQNIGERPCCAGMATTPSAARGVTSIRRIDRQSQYLDVARTGRSTPLIVATPLMLSQARPSLFGPRVRESTRTTSVPPFGVPLRGGARAGFSVVSKPRQRRCFRIAGAQTGLRKQRQ